MKFDIDNYREIIDTITRNKTRSFLTGFGVFWGVFMLIFLIGGGKGLKEMLQKNFAGFATNSAMVWTQNTTKPYKGFRKGRYFSMVEKDMERLRQHVPELDVITPVMFGGTKDAVVGDKSFTANISGVSFDYPEINPPIMFYGRFLNEMDIREGRKVCVIGKEVYKKLFPGGGDPCGKSIRIDGTYYKVVGVDYKVDGININGSPDQLVNTILAVQKDIQLWRPNTQPCCYSQARSGDEFHNRPHANSDSQGTYRRSYRREGRDAFQHRATLHHARQPV